MTAEQCEANGRSLESIKKCCTNSTVDNRLGCIDLPLLEIELDHVVVDELHILLRITDKLISALVFRMANLDHVNRVHGTGHPDNMKRLVSAIHSCGVSFQVKILLV